MADDAPLLEVRHLRRQSRSGDVLLDDICFSVKAGENWALTGSSGAGKTLLMRAMAFLDQSEGELLWRGKSVDDHEVPEYRSRVTYLAQMPAVVEGTVRENLRLIWELTLHRHRAWPEEQIVQRCRQFGKDNSFLTRNSSDLSGGERQIVALLRVLLIDSQILLLDEATSALDPTMVRVYEQLIEDWRNECPAERAVVWVSHDDRQQQRVASQVLSLEHGRVVEGASCSTN